MTPSRKRPTRRLAPLAAALGLGAALLTAGAAGAAAEDGVAAGATSATRGVTAAAGAAVAPHARPAVRQVRRFRGRTVNPLSGGSPLYVEQAGNAAAQAAEWRAMRPQDAELMRHIAEQPQGFWIGDWVRDVRASVARRVAAARRAGTVPVLVLYNVPARDCGLHSSGGAASAAAYRRWVDRVASGIGRAPATVIVEPDALSALDCMGRAARAERVRLLAWAVQRLSRQPAAAVYLDAGNPGWKPAGVVARRLRSAGVARARGFAVNVSGFETTERARAYGRAISRRTGRAHFVIDTSRNGNGPAPGGEWCNPPGRALGPDPTTDTGDPLIDAFLWVKRPGESDGVCNGGPPAGRWWPEYALALAREAAGR
ncbi:glycoside hydrolase family 6 protein [Miltoncostaea marina]|uniref:glycoside hydrolase family 6 protein n=1 Tax=Miltoncostaea marina TaxID=2843215 RepID=UPI001C3C8ABA|nr:glycoside hydrolase family 6 protein [Miltoncostaea marina]